MVQRREMWKTIALPITATGVLWLLSMVLLYVFALQPQATLLESVFPAEAAWPIAIVLVLVEALAFIFIAIQLLFVRMLSTIMHVFPSSSSSSLLLLLLLLLLFVDYTCRQTILAVGLLIGWSCSWCIRLQGQAVLSGV
jgi:uncharacterized integral membrane protein